MNGAVFLLTWLYGLIIMASISYMSFHVMEAWVLRHVKPCLLFGLSTLIVELIGLTLFAVCATKLSSTVDAMGYAAAYFAISAVSLWVMCRFIKVCELP